MVFLTILLMSKLNVWLKILTNKINTATLHPINKHLSNFLPQPNALQLKISRKNIKIIDSKKHTPH